jgi:2-dehydro-3-deoxy-D-arabinonate dehydratase
MKLVKYRIGADRPLIGLLERDHIVPLASPGGQYESLTDVLASDDPAATAEFLADRTAEPIAVGQVNLLPPIDRQEVWAAGVTYRRSKTARMEESQGAARFYDLVYEAPRPELFFKASPHRVVGPHQAVRIRQDSKWNVPEPELALVLNTDLRLVGFTIGNGMSSRDIEGENPLYLPQAKVYNGCCALGPCITLVGWMPTLKSTSINLAVHRGQQVAFQGETNLGAMARTFEDLIGWLGRDNTFPDGVFLLTGTGIVPADDFTLRPGDVVEISIEGIGTLLNPVVQG